MVHLTFVRFAQPATDGRILLKSAQQLFLLAKIVVEKYGKPQAVYCSSDDGGIQSAKIINLACTVHGINETFALGLKATKHDVKALMDNLEIEAEQAKHTHLVLVVSHNVAKALWSDGLMPGNSCTLSASSWKNIAEAYTEQWSPLKSDDSDTSMEELIDLSNKLFNTPCRADETLIIKQTLQTFTPV